MAWREVKVDEQRQEFIKLYLEEQLPIAELCRQFEISRPTGYKWIERYQQLGIEGLMDQSRAPHSHPCTTPQSVVNEILKMKARFKHFGARKVLGRLQDDYPEEQWPSDTTIHNILDREGLVMPRKIRRRVSPQQTSLTHCEECNQVWSVDFKGWFLTGDGRKCEPLTITDNYSRYLLHCAALPRNNTDHVWRHFDYVFREYGLPLFLRSDNGSPFGSTGVGRLCGLAIKLIKAGVTPEWITPGRPQENGRHERMHRTLKKETATPPAKTLQAQRDRFIEFRAYYNNDRPHQALGQKTPGSVFTSSPRQWTGRLKSPEYPEEFTVHKVHSCGKINRLSGSVYIGRVLENEPVGLKELGDGTYEVFYGPIMIGYVNHQNEFTRPQSPSRRTKIRNLIG